METVLEMIPSPYVRDCKDYGQEMTRGLSTAWQTACASVEHAQKYQKVQYNKKADSHPHQRLPQKFKVAWCVANKPHTLPCPLNVFKFI